MKITDQWTLSNNRMVLVDTADITERQKIPFLCMGSIEDKFIDSYQVPLIV